MSYTNRKHLIMKKKNPQNKLATWLVTLGSLLLVAGFSVPPTGEIPPSVLVAYGEVMTFAGALLGIEYRYRNK